ncbi:hypothetical protein Tco_1423113, partial [Tanacetum coccineum]
GEVEITATINGQLKTITEASLRRHPKLEDADDIRLLPNTEIFEQLALMGTDTEILLDQKEPTELVGDLGSCEKGEKEISTANILVSTASATPEVSTAAENLVYMLGIKSFYKVILLMDLVLLFEDLCCY